MAAHKLDQLFKKKMHRQVSEPSADAWTKMESMLDQPSEKSIWVTYRMAAAVLLLVVSGFVIYQFLNNNNHTQKTEIAIVEEDAVELIQETQTTPELTTEKLSAENLVPKIDTENVQTPERVEPFKAKKKSEIEVQQVADNMKKKVEELSNADSFDHIESDTENLIAMDHETSGFSIEHVDMNVVDDKPANTPKKKKRLPVKIIYKRGKKTQPKTLVAQNDTINRKRFNFNRIIDATKNITSGDLLADIRDAKDNLFSQGLDFKKSERFKNENSNK